MFSVRFGIYLWFKETATFNNISAMSWRSVLLVEETEVPAKKHRPAASHWQTLSQSVVSSTPCLSGNRSIHRYSRTGQPHPLFSKLQNLNCIVSFSYYFQFNYTWIWYNITTLVTLSILNSRVHLCIELQTLNGVRVTRSLVLYVCFVDRCLSFCIFPPHYVVCSSSIYGFWLPLWYLQTLLWFYSLKTNFFFVFHGSKKLKYTIILCSSSCICKWWMEEITICLFLLFSCLLFHSICLSIDKFLRDEKNPSLLYCWCQEP
jgi:hypothetical protein